jgi:hypothetical protein
MSVSIYCYLKIGGGGPGDPMRLMRHDDHRVYTMKSDLALESELQRQGYILIYDRMD